MNHDANVDRSVRARLFRTLAGWLPLWGLAVSVSLSAATLRTENVVLITADGLRWQEVFRGAELALMNKEHGHVPDVEDLKKQFWRETPEARRQALMPFFWSEIATKGQLAGNRDRGSVARVLNGHNFSYPGYNEILTGAPDARVDSNAKRPNPNVTVLEWLHQQPGFKGRVAAFGCWDVFPFILNRERAGFHVRAGWEIVDEPNPARESLLRVLRATPRVWEGVTYDAFMFDAALDHIRKHRPRVVYLAFGETDDWAHDGRYDLYLKAAQGFDRMVGELWSFCQSHPAYRGKTSFLITTDHGRGIDGTSWKSHGKDLAESAYIWFAALGPDTPARGEWPGGSELTQGQTAATTAALLGKDFRAAFPQAAETIGAFVSGTRRGR